MNLDQNFVLFSILIISFILLYYINLHEKFRGGAESTDPEEVLEEETAQSAETLEIVQVQSDETSQSEAVAQSEAAAQSAQAEAASQAEAVAQSEASAQSEAVAQAEAASQSEAAAQAEVTETIDTEPIMSDDETEDTTTQNNDEFKIDTNTAVQNAVNNECIVDEAIYRDFVRKIENCPTIKFLGGYTNNIYD